MFSHVSRKSPPEPERKRAHVPQRSYIAYVWRGDKFDEIGSAMTRLDGHDLTLTLGTRSGEVIELRSAEDRFNAGIPKIAQAAPQPSVTAFIAQTQVRTGTAFPHKDGKAHRLKCRTDPPDGTMI